MDVRNPTLEIPIYEVELQSTNFEKSKFLKCLLGAIIAYWEHVAKQLGNSLGDVKKKSSASLDVG